VSVTGGGARPGIDMRPLAGWAALPTTSRPRWWLPSRPGRSTRAALAIYQPVTRRGRAGWRAARMAAGLGGFQLLPRAAPPEPVLDLVGPYVPAGGQYSVMQANHPHRFVTLVVDRAGRPFRVGKVALTTDGQQALAREAAALAGFGQRLATPLQAPELVAHEPQILVTQAIEWQVRRTPWKLPAEVASALGALFRASDQLGSGLAHGDCTPWNLLSSAGSWVLVDWEGASTSAPPLHDVFHYFVQSHLLLGRPTGHDILEGLAGRGWIGAAIHAYSDAAGLQVATAPDHLLTYLRHERADKGPGRAQDAPEARQRLLVAAEQWVARRTLRPAAAP
jgi:hypothetical protein